MKVGYVSGVNEHAEVDISPRTTGRKSQLKMNDHIVNTRHSPDKLSRLTSLVSNADRYFHRPPKQFRYVDSDPTPHAVNLIECNSLPKVVMLWKTRLVPAGGAVTVRAVVGSLGGVALPRSLAVTNRSGSPLVEPTVTVNCPWSELKLLSLLHSTVLPARPISISAFMRSAAFTSYNPNKPSLQ